MIWSSRQTARRASRFRAASRLRRRAFTLIEMMVVLVIASVLTGMAVYGYQTIGRNVVASSGRQVNAQLRLCRSYAVAKREYVALLLPDGADMQAADMQLATNLNVSADVESALRDQYGNEGMRPCIVTISGGTITFQEYIKGGEWQFVNQGVSILPDATETCVNVAFPESSGSTMAMDMKCIIFKPTGQLNNAGTITIDVRRDDLGATQQDNTTKLSLNWLTGKVSYVE
jgi:prepilin-type N-terminal cleavage/methylation domain-containing protein